MMYIINIKQSYSYVLCKGDPVSEGNWGGGKQTEVIKLSALQTYACSP